MMLSPELPLKSVAQQKSPLRVSDHLTTTAPMYVSTPLSSHLLIKSFQPCLLCFVRAHQDKPIKFWCLDDEMRVLAHFLVVQ